CEGCEEIVENALEDVRSVESVAVDREAGTAVVDGDPNLQDLIDAVDYAGYTAEEAADAETA
ncbi:MAG: heavy-metal-associated domain-containing protein, partial [Halodesulfurarchaeum sp.]